MARLKPGPLVVACEIVTLLLPELVTVTDKLLLFPSCTLPKFRLAGLAASWPAATAVPVTENVIVGAEGRSVVSEIVPDGVPAAWGAKMTLITVLCPAARVRGSGGPPN